MSFQYCYSLGSIIIISPKEYGKKNKKNTETQKSRLVGKPGRKNERQKRKKHDIDRSRKRITRRDKAEPDDAATRGTR